MKYLISVTLLLLILSNANGLNMKQLRVPSQVDLRDEVTLSCEFDLEGKGLYSVKWYKDEFEFYKYMPDNRPPDSSFPVPGINLDVQRSNMTSVRLRQLSFNSSGTYRCEVSTEAPNFKTVIAKGNMTVMALPQHDPLIDGVMSEYSPGDYVIGNCTSARSNPAAVLSWYINDAKVDHWFVLPYPTSTEYVDNIGLHTRSLGLRFPVDKSHFLGSGNELVIRCDATIDSRVWRGTTKSVLSNKLTNQKLAQERQRNAAASTASSFLSMVVFVTSLLKVVSS